MALLIDYAHDELDAEQSSRITAHLSSCSDCALAFCQLRADLAGISPALSETPSPRVRDQLARQVEREFGLPWWRLLTAQVYRRVPAYSLAVAALIPIALWAVTSWRTPERDIPAEQPRETIASQPVLEDFDGASVLPDLDLI